jgi:glycosyltransferase involved in cell wall biosynthesis
MMITAGASPSIPDATVAAADTQQCVVDTTLLTGGFDKPYALGLATALAAKSVRTAVIGSDEVDSPAMHTTPGLTFLNLAGSGPERGLVRKLSNILTYYARLIRYAAASRSKVVHILWNGKFQWFDRTVLMLYFRMLGKFVVLTVHNVNVGKRDSSDSWLNRSTLRMQYRLADHLFVHTAKMKSELCSEFGVSDQVVTVIPFGINTTVPRTQLTPDEAKERLGIKPGQKTVLFFGGIRPYKGLEYLVEAFLELTDDPEYRLIIAGFAKKGSEQYLKTIQQRIDGSPAREKVVQRIEYIPDEDTELYFKAADALVLPYTYVFQSGVLFLAYGFGLPVIASDVGSVAEDVIEGKTGFLCKPCDSEGLAEAIRKYFASDLFRELEQRRVDISEYTEARHSWDTVGTMTRTVYEQLLRVSE